MLIIYFPNTIGNDDKVLLESMLGKKLTQDSPNVYQSALWTIVEFSTGDLSQMVLLRCAIENALNSVPIHIHSSLYTHCFVELCAIGDTGETRKSKRKSTLVQAIESALGQKPTKVILIALLHTDDLFVNEEKKLVQSDLFISRGILNANIELKSIHSLEELYAMSLQFVNYEAKLYGPQEDELGDLINPLQFAKEMRQQKKEIGALLQGLQEKSKDELQEVCRKLGVRDICKYKKELVERLQTALSFKKEIVGHGELSHFGKQIIAKMFMRSKNPLTFNTHGHNTPAHSDQSVEEVIASSSSKYNENGLSLWEFNKYLGTLQAKTMYDKAAYKSFLEEQQALVNRDEQLLLPGLFNIYEKLGHLADDNQYWSIGSIDEMFAGTLQCQCSFEPEAFKSLLNLLPDSPRLFIPKLFEFFQRLGNIKQYEADMELDSLSELIELLPWDILHMEELRDCLVSMCKKPGYLAEYLNDFVSYLNDIDIGPLHALRSYVAALLDDTLVSSAGRPVDEQPSFAQDERLHCFEEDFVVKFSQQMEFMLLKAYEETPLYMATANAGEVRERAPAESAVGGGLDMGIAIEKTETLGAESPGNQPADEERMELPRNVENIRVFGDKSLNFRLYEESARNLLPAMLHSSSIDYYKMKTDIIQDIEFLQTVREVENLTLSLEESIAIDSRKELLEKTLQEVLHILDEQDKQQPAHLLAAYDAMRMFGKAISSVGLGSKDITMRLNVDGVNALQLLPAGLGEANDIQRLNEEKNERYAHRRQAALAAIERERLRRAMTDEDYERIKQEKLRKERLFYEAQDKLVYDEAIRKLYESREEKKTMAELGQIVKLFEEFFKRKQNRGGGGIDSIIAKNNIACVMVEVYGVEHPLSQPAQYFLQEAVEALPSVLDDLKDEVASVNTGSKDDKSTQKEQQGNCYAI
ncbi:hypothetical protein EON65_11580 [archaeon]|nr:MAG: hypothetical protein EON65_11580 [archaeon]